MTAVSEHPGQAARADAGFTLIETIVTIGLLALILAMMPGTFRLGHRAWEVAGALDRSADDAATRSFLEQRIAEAMPLYEQTRSGILKVAFEGKPNAVTFIAPAPSGSKGGGLYQYRIDIRAGRGAFAPGLWLEQSLYKLGGTAERLDQHILFSDVTGVRFRYFGRPEPKADPVWQEQWPRQDTIPDLVEVSFEERPGSGPRMQPMVVELKMKMVR